MVGFEGFEFHRERIGGSEVAWREGGTAGGAPVVLLHGFPQTHVMWRRVAQRLSRRYRLVLPDLRGYGDSAKPDGGEGHAAYSKRAMAAEIVALMGERGHERFAVVGHDRGARVAHRLALDHAERVSALALIDIAPTLDMYAATDMRFATLYYHWFHLIQPAPLPERMIAADASGYLRAKLGAWGGGGRHFAEPEALAEYERCFCTDAGIHGACEDYRASATIDLGHDRASRAAGQRIACDTLVLWGERGVVARLFDPMALWTAQCAGALVGRALPAGHFVPEELPDETAAALRDHLG